MDDIVLQKAMSIERCLNRALEEYKLAGKNFDTNYTHQDAAILNLQRACEQTIDLSNHIIRIKQWGLPDTSRATFSILVSNQFIPEILGENLKKMVGFRNIAIHEYGSMNVEILKKIILERLDDFREFCSIAIKNMVK
jgi:uncharacterized protein YutE (UPF0331/DUF86 family)